MLEEMEKKSGRLVADVSLPSQTSSLITTSNNVSKGDGKGQGRSAVQVQRKFAPKEKKVAGRGGGRAPEVGSIQAPGAKKREWDNIFYFAPRDRGSSHLRHHQGGGGRGLLPHHRTRNESGGFPKGKFKKEDFLRANCQFLVKAGKDYEPYIADPDLLVEWTDVEEIVVTMIGEGASCPICLGPPVAAKITKCGHIYCWPCILHYLALSDNEYRACPICYEHVGAKDLKSVVTRAHFDVELGDIVDMELLRRHKDQRFVTPLHAHEATEDWSELYSKVLVISVDDIMGKVLNREEQELNVALKKDPDCPEACFVHQALTQLEERKKSLTESPLETDKKSPETNSPQENPSDHAEDSPYFYFYQASNGLNIFLHPLNFSMLSHEYGTDDMSCWPRYLSFRVIDKEYYSACEDIRKRWKFLKHLPVSTPFIFVEADLSEYVSPKILTEFAHQMQARRMRRQERIKEERKMEKIIAERERKLWKIPVVASFEPQLDFPEFTDADMAEELKFPELESSPLATSCSLTSFAQIASRAPTIAPPILKKSPSFPVTKAAEHHNRHSESDAEPEDYVAVPDFRNSISDAITKAMENLNTSGAGGENGQKKKKKNKGKVLFATGMGFN